MEGNLSQVQFLEPGTLSEDCALLFIVPTTDEPIYCQNVAIQAYDVCSRPADHQDVEQGRATMSCRI